MVSPPQPSEKLNTLMQCLPDAPFKTHMAEEVKAYGQACREQALEEAASVCEAAIASIWDYHDDGRKQIGTTVCNNLAAAIRKIKEQP